MKCLSPVFAVGLLALTAGPVLAQDSDRYASVEVRAGYTKPSGNAADTLKGQSSFGVGAAIAVGTRMHLGLSADWAHHSVYQYPGKTVIGGAEDEQWNLLHAFLKVSFDLVNTDKFSFGVNAGPGIIVFAPNQVVRDATGARTDAHFAVNGGATGVWWFADRIGLMASVQADYAMKKSGGQIFTDGGALFLPLTGGFRFKI